MSFYSELVIFYQLAKSIDRHIWTIVFSKSEWNQQRMCSIPNLDEDKYHPQGKRPENFNTNIYMNLEADFCSKYLIFKFRLCWRKRVRPIRKHSHRCFHSEELNRGSFDVKNFKRAVLCIEGKTSESHWAGDRHVNDYSLLDHPCSIV